MLAHECFQALAARWDQEVVICSLGATSFNWWRITSSDKPFYMTSSMGLVPSFALGLALGLPEAKVWALDSDGGLAMNLSSLLTEAAEQPANLAHFLLSNRCYQTIGGHGLVNAENTDWGVLAAGVGMPADDILTVSTVDDLEAALDRVAEGGYKFVVMEVEAEDRGTRLPVAYEGPEMKYRFGRQMEAQFGHSVFGEFGY